MTTLRPYQAEAIDACLEALRSTQRVLVCMPTGCGKTVTFAEIAARYAQAGHRVCVLAHRKELLDQAAGKLRAASGIEPAIEQAERAEATDDSLLVVASVQSMISRLDRFPGDHFRLLIIDEAHRSLAPTYVRLLEHFQCKVLGFTATPNRGDERALGQVYGAVGYDLTLADAIEQGWLVPPRVITIEAPSLDLGKVRTRSGELVAGELGTVLSEIAVLREAIGPALRHAAALKTLVFCATRAHMACVAACIEEMAGDLGYELRVDMVDGTTPAAERDEIFERFRASADRHWLLNIDVATEGFDEPGVGALLLLRPTLARSRYMQMVGRGLRPLAGVVDGVSVEDALVRLDLAESQGADLDHLIAHRSSLMLAGTDAFARRVMIAASAKPSCLILDVAGNASRHELANPLDLLGGDFEAVEIRRAEQLVADGLAPNLWAALEQARLERERQRQARLARLGDPFALFGLPVPARDRWGRKPLPKQRAVIDALQQPRNIDDAREADVLVRELARREAAGLASYSQLRLLARFGGPSDDLRRLPRLQTLSRREAAAVIRAIAATGWRRPLQVMLDELMKLDV